MDKKISAIIAIMALIVAIGGITYGVSATKERDKLRAELNEATEESMNTSAPQTGIAYIEGDNGALLTQNEELKDQIALLKQQIAQLQQNTPESTTQQRARRTDRLAQLKEENPERYAEIMQRREERFTQMRTERENRMNTMFDLNTTGMTAAELANHEALLARLSEMENMANNFDPENPPSREDMEAGRLAMQELGQMMDAEKNTVKTLIGEDFGLSAADAAELVETLSTIDSTYSFGGGMRGGPPGGGRR